MARKEVMQFRGGVMYDSSGKKIMDNVEGSVKILMPVEVRHSTRWGMGYNYHEKGYYCPKCGELIAYHNGVVLESGNYGQKFCHNCGYKLNWRDTKEKENLCDVVRIKTADVSI